MLHLSPSLGSLDGVKYVAQLVLIFWAASWQEYEKEKSNSEDILW